MSVEYSIISIGTLSHNVVWKETKPVRSQHATTTLVTDGDRRILVDPSLPGEILTARLMERCGVGPESITDIFCTTLRPDFRRAIESGIFASAKWWCGETELEWYARCLDETTETAERLGNADTDDLKRELDLVRKFKPAPEKFTEQIATYPLFGATPGCTGLLLTPQVHTIVVTGPAAATREHLQRGIIWEQSADQDTAMKSLGDMLELADVIIPGFDNVTFSPRQWM
ncbi:MAG: hypothetical protein KAR11_07555 [Phycisphaerae bacterium]|nr:hypothetical protein [Phycisphaerae bacterium]